MNPDAIAMFHVVDASLKARLGERLQQSPTGADLLAWPLYERFPSAGDEAQLTHLARMVYGVLSELADEVVGNEPGVWVVPDDEAVAPPTTLDEVRRRGICLTRAQAGSPAQHAADLRFEVDAMTRVARVLERLPPEASLDEQVSEVLSTFAADERETLDALAVREGARSFSEQLRGTLVAARPGGGPVFAAKAEDGSRVADLLAAPRFADLRRRGEAWTRVTDVLEGLPPSLCVDDKVQGVLLALTPAEREALDALAADEDLPSFAIQLEHLLADD